MKKVCFAIAFASMMAICASCEKSGNEGEGGADASGAVDLGLSVKWASCNLGASSPYENGNYYAWGEITTKEKYVKETYRFYELREDAWEPYILKYNISSDYGHVDNKTQLDRADDAAHVILGGKWRIPTKQEWDELISNCTWEFIIKNRKEYLEFTSKKNGRSIIFPSAGTYDGKHGLIGVGDSGGYWSSSLYKNDPESAYALVWEEYEDIGSDYDGDYRYCGLSIRPIKD